MGFSSTSSELISPCRSVHPYDHEIKTLSFPPSIFTSTAPVPVKSFDSTPFHWVSTPKQLEVMLATLRNAHEIAIDLEHHDYRTFAGFLCLMQISTREADYVIDLLVLREEVHALNEVFTDPKIVKVSNLYHYLGTRSRVFRSSMAQRVT